VPDPEVIAPTERRMAGIRTLAAVLERRPNSPGAGTLKRVLHGDVRVTLSALERRFLERLQGARSRTAADHLVAGGRKPHDAVAMQVALAVNVAAGKRECGFGL
jgi:hypothetical protein